MPETTTGVGCSAIRVNRVKDSSFLLCCDSTPWRPMALLLPSTRASLLSFLALVLIISTFSLHRSTTSSSLSFNSFSSSSSSSSRCPSVYDRGRPPVYHSAHTCHPVPSKIPSFELQVCYTEDVCNQFSLRIKRTSAKECREQENTPDPSEDRALTKWMRKQRGPDGFYMKTDGPERYASVYPTYEGSCTYSFDVRLKNPGDTYVSIWWTFQVGLSYLGPWSMS